eukprot:2993454-Prorocentrum_lima.AAC.1
MEENLDAHLGTNRHVFQKQCTCEIIWRDNRDVIVDPLTKGRTHRNVLNTVLQSPIYLAGDNDGSFNCAINDNAKLPEHCSKRLQRVANELSQNISLADAA